jgi:hypothetical protein
MLHDYPSIALDPIPGFPGYFACRLGVIFSTLRFGYPVPLRSYPIKGGYLQVNLFRDGKHRPKRVHQLILEAYIGPCPPGMETRHINNIPSDNRLSNLRWGTRAENDEDKRLAGSLKGTLNPKAKLTEEDVRSIRTMKTSDAVKKYGIHCNNVYLIKNRQTWKHIE